MMNHHRNLRKPRRSAAVLPDTACRKCRATRERLKRWPIVLGLVVQGAVALAAVLVELRSVVGKLLELVARLKRGS